MDYVRWKIDAEFVGSAALMPTLASNDELQLPTVCLIGEAGAFDVATMVIF
jgi:hypothetical protein